MPLQPLPTEPFDLLPGTPALEIRDHHGEVDMVIWGIKWGDWLSCWMVIEDNGDCYDSGYIFASHGAALDDALEFIQDAIINRDMDWGE